MNILCIVRSRTDIFDFLFFIRCAAERKVNNMVNRIRLVKVHICVLGTIRKMTPSLFGKTKSREHILNNLHTIMENVRVQFDLSKGDMPDAAEFARCLRNFSDFSVFPSIDNELIRCLDMLIEKEIPEIINDAEVVASEARMGRYKNNTKIANKVAATLDGSHQSRKDQRDMKIQQQSEVSKHLYPKYLDT